MGLFIKTLEEQISAKRHEIQRLDRDLGRLASRRQKTTDPSSTAFEKIAREEARLNHKKTQLIADIQRLQRRAAA